MKRPRSPFRFDQDEACRAIDFIETLCRHSKGEWSGRRFKMAEWQREIVAQAFGWKRRDGTRKHRRVFTFVPRKNGKSTWAAAVATYLTFADREPSAEIYSAAADRMQASLVFGEAKAMVLQEDLLRERASIYARAIVCPATLSSYRVLSADAKTKHGLNPHGVIFDELHAQDDRELYDVLTTGSGARRQPIFWMMTTAGYDIDSICYEVYEYARRVKCGDIDDPEFLPVLYEAPREADWTSPEVWASANPNLGVTIKADALAVECERAKRSPAYENTFRRLHLNQWTEQETRWLGVDVWDRGATPLLPLPGRDCYIGLDLSRRTDVTAAVAYFPGTDGTGDVLPHFWIPAERMAERERYDKVPYTKWVRDGLVTATPGNAIDYSFVESQIDQWARVYTVREVAYDPWGATQLAQRLQDQGLVCVEFRQGYRSMSEPMKSVEAALLEGKIRHGGHAVLRSHFANVAAEMDPAGNIKPSKRLSRGRIDGFVAMLMAYGRATLQPAQASVYEVRGVRSV